MSKTSVRQIKSLNDFVSIDAISHKKFKITPEYPDDILYDMEKNIVTAPKKVDIKKQIDAPSLNNITKE